MTTHLIKTVPMAGIVSNVSSGSRTRRKKAWDSLVMFARYLFPELAA